MTDEKNNYGGELMKITKSQLKQIIKEELNKTLKEADFIGPFAPPRVGLDTTGKLKPGTVIPGGMEPAEDFYDIADKLDLFELPAKLDQVADLFTQFNVEIKPGIGLSSEKAAEKVRQISEMLKTQFLDF